MELEELCWELVRNVGLVEANSQEEGSRVVLTEELLGSLGDLNVRQRPARLFRHQDWTEDVRVSPPVQSLTDGAVLVSLGGWMVGRAGPTVGLVVVVVARYARVEYLAQRHSSLATVWTAVNSLKRF